MCTRAVAGRHRCSLASALRNCEGEENSIDSTNNCIRIYFCHTSRAINGYPLTINYPGSRSNIDNGYPWKKGVQEKLTHEEHEDNATMPKLVSYVDCVHYFLVLRLIVSSSSK